MGELYKEKRIRIIGTTTTVARNAPNGCFLFVVHSTRSHLQRTVVSARGECPQKVPAQRYPTCINRLPHDHGAIKNDNLSLLPPCRPSVTHPPQTTAVLSVFDGCADPELDPLSGERSDNPGALPNCSLANSIN